MCTTNFLLYLFAEPAILSPTTGPSLLRSFSAPPSLTKYLIFIDVLKLYFVLLGVEVSWIMHGKNCMYRFYWCGLYFHLFRHSRSAAVAHHSVLDISSCSPTHTTSLLDQIFQFIGDQPETAVSN